MASALVLETCRAATARIAAGDPWGGEALLAGALARAPRDPNLLYVAGNCALARGDHSLALERYQRSVAAAPTFVAALVNLGFVLRTAQRLAEARDVLAHAVTLEPGHRLAWTNLVSTYVNEGEPAAGEVVARAALSLHPADPVLRWNLSLLLLEQGRWREGWQEYRHRFDTPVVARPPGVEGIARLEHPDQITAGDMVLCHGEQGLGDEILFAGVLAEFVDAARSRGGEVMLAANPRLAGLFSRTFGLPTRGAAQPAWVVAIGDLPRFFRTTADDFPRRGAYLSVDPAAVAEMRATLRARAAGRPLVGIAWRGGSAYTHSVHRTIPVGQWLPILRHDALFVSLAYHDATPEIAAVAAEGITIVDLPGVTTADDYQRTCELVAALDLVITVPTSVVHAAGGVSTPCWVVMDQRAAWRECSCDSSIPWYPLTHRRFIRPKTARVWADTMGDVATALQTWRTSHSASPSKY
jgi:Tfp pilus assembly protein PilF